MQRSIVQSEDVSQHPDADQLVLFVEGRLGEDRYAMIENHLANCDSCCEVLGNLDRESRVNRVMRNAHNDGRLVTFDSSMRKTGEGLSGGAQSRFDTIEEIDRGGMGIVSRVLDRHLNREVALKTIAPDVDSTETRRRFENEARIGARLNHPGIATVYDLAEFDDGRPFLTMKLVRGETLHDRIRHNSSLTSLLSVFVKLCECIGFAHAQGVVHRDLKPENVMVGEFGEVQVMDWGLARLQDLEPGPSRVNSATVEVSSKNKVVDSTAVDSVPDELDGSNRSTVREIGSGLQHGDPHTRAGSVLGTPAYMAPEQANGQVEQVDIRSDVFGLGAVLCEILTGQPPYPGLNAEASFELAKSGDLSVAKAALESNRVPVDLAGLAVRCLSPNKTDRPDFAADVAQCVIDWQENVSAQLRESELARVKSDAKLSEERKRRRTQLMLLGVVFLFGAVGILLWATIEKQRNDFATQKAAHQAEELSKVSSSLKLHHRATQAAFENFPKDERDWQEASVLLQEVATFVGRYPDSDIAAEFTTASKSLSEKQEAAAADKKLLNDLNVLDGLRKPLAKVSSKDLTANLPMAPRLSGRSRNQIRQNSSELSDAAASGFSHYGFELLLSRPEEAASYILTRPKRFQRELLPWLEVWMHHATVGRLEGDARWICELLSLLDADPHRARIRKAIVDRGQGIP